MLQSEEKLQNKENPANAEAKAKKKRKAKEIAPFGNYRNYYGYRLGNDMEEDPRFKIFKKEWFEDKDCLDIGCNNGLITIHIAEKFNCRSILGLDIDRDRVKDAQWNLEKIVRKEEFRKGKTHASKQNISMQSDVTPVDGDQSGVENDVPSVEQRKTLSDMVSFQHENFITCHPLPLKHYDTIVCLSVTKWIHLNWGDDGLITLFARMWRHLLPGGILVLEPQPWKSYHSNRLVTETTAANYKTIGLYPEEFQEILLDKIGFRAVENVTSSLPGTTAGFSRPLLVLRK